MLYRLHEAMAGRNGFDRLGIALFIALFIIEFFSGFWPVLRFFALAVAAIALWRIFSKNLAKRRAENYRFTRISSDIAESFTRFRYRRQEAKQYKFFKCPSCKSTLRVPRRKGKISVTCPRCGQKFQKKT